LLAFDVLDFFDFFALFVFLLPPLVGVSGCLEPHGQDNLGNDKNGFFSYTF
jgi:hypothetical protein